MILAVTLNLAIDKVAIAPALQVGRETRIDLVSNLPGGKGINVARAIRSLDDDAWVTGLVGGKNGEFIQEGMQREGIHPLLFRMEPENRVCLILVDEQGQTSEIYEQGPQIEEEVQEAYLVFFQSILSRFSTITLSGSLPKGFPPNYYDHLLADRETNILLDISGPALLATLARPIHLLKINEHEFRSTFHAEDVAAALPGVLASYRLGQIVVTLGERGALTQLEGRTVRIFPRYSPPVRCPVGAGDAFLGSLAVSIERKEPYREAVCRAVAASASNVTLYEGGRVNRLEYEKILPTIQIEEG
jgi:tagatose 6-phosphate kinase